MKQKAVIIAVVTVALGGLIGMTAWPAKPPMSDALPGEHPAVWTEAAWPFPIDQWGLGKAFRCAASDCGAEVSVYLRAKIGFCNCTTGVADDEELDRISDGSLLGDRVSPRGPGRPITVAWMKGRSRDYAIDGPYKSMLSIGFNDRCDAIVATAVHRQQNAEQIEPAVLAFLNSKTVLHWAELKLGL